MKKKSRLKLFRPALLLLVNFGLFFLFKQCHIEAVKACF